MPRPTAEARSQLDQYVQALARLGDGLTLNDFRSEAIKEAQRIGRRVQFHAVLMSVVFLTLTIGVLIAQYWLGKATPIFAAVWSLALGGLGAVASIFLHLLKLMPQQTFNSSDQFEFFGRILLGCLFSMVLSITLVDDVYGFMNSLAASEKTRDRFPMALAPFILGYSIPLVLRLLEKITQAVELTIGVEDRRTTATLSRVGRRSNQRTP